MENKEAVKTSTEELLKMQNEIKADKETEMRLKGNLETVEKSLKENGCNSIEEANSKIEELNKEYTEKSEELIAETKKVKESREWKTV